MSVVVLVHLQGVTPEKIEAANAANPDIREKFMSIVGKYSDRGHRRLMRLVGENEVIDIDEWESEESFHEFKAEAQELIAEMARLRGAPVPTDSIWRM